MIAKELIDDVSPFLPLQVDFITWNDPALILAGKGWELSTVSSWRIVNNKNVLELGCYDKGALEALEELQKNPIVSIELQSSHLLSDPFLIFGNGYKLEVFSTTFLEPWVFNSPSGIAYVASPSNE